MSEKHSDCDSCHMCVVDLEASSHTNHQEKDDEICKVTKGDITTPVTTLPSDGNCLPTLQEIEHSDHHHCNEKKSPLFFCYCASKHVISGVVAAAMLIAFFAIAMFIYHQVSPSSVPSALVGKSSSDQRFTSQYQRTMEYLVQNKISTATSLSTYGTPQYYATSYIANQLQLPVPTPISSSSSSPSLDDDAILQQQQTYRYIARYVLALDYYHFTNYNVTYHDYHHQQLSSDMQQYQETVTPPPKFLNFVTSGMDICQWNYRSNNTSSLADTDIVDYYDTMSIQMGVTCSLSTKLPINLTISNLNLYGTLPTENGLLTSLQIFNIEHNDVIGTIPTELFQLTNLDYLNLGRNALTGSIPTEIGRLSNLEKFILNSNRGVSGSVPASIAQLTSLRTVYLDGTGLTSGVDHICTLPNFRDGGGTDDDGMVAYADCGNVDGIAVEVNCECCRCCADIANNGMGCSMDLI